MRTKKLWKSATRWLLGSGEPATGRCCIGRCDAKPLVAVAGDDSGPTMMCVHHAIAWSESSLCRDYAQHNSNATDTALSTWVAVSAESTVSPEPKRGPTVFIPSSRTLMPPRAA